MLNETGRFEADWIEHQLAHQPRGVRGAYNAARYLQHRRPMMQWWADYLDAAEVVGLKRQASEMPIFATPALPSVDRLLPWKKEGALGQVSGSC